METVASIFRLNLRKHMRKKNLTQAELARRCGFAKSTICAWLSGEFRPKSIDMIMPLCREFNVTPEKLMYGEDPTLDDVIRRLNEKEEKLISAETKIFNMRFKILHYEQILDALRAKGVEIPNVALNTKKALQ